MSKKRIYLSSPTMHGEEQKFVQEAFDTNWVAPLGPNVNELEKEVASYTGTKAAAALSAGTAAIHLALKLADVKEGDIVCFKNKNNFCQVSCKKTMYQYEKNIMKLNLLTVQADLKETRYIFRI